jgi:hypothetical protein
MDTKTLDLQKVCDLLKGADIPAYVEQTGGGIATIFAGKMDADDRYEAVAGPGWFDGPGWTLPRGDTSGFSVGPDTDDNYAESVFADATWDETRVASTIAGIIKS